ncbi:hypothetical protein Q4S45_06190 [Massilia sp. R2A-15]|uniref:hypothetical protein n=1 Tax=Massilia sp. R2A-15 TaxID=3064278 RepID=UPI002734BC9D|nr:hypothetical protein [Massilia sp. R2A-15]WLI90706.1 hypothetical protein Q4S45_06190 [Massilia sp. R2A-15]
MNKNPRNAAMLVAGLCAMTTAVIVGCGGGGGSSSSPPPPAPTYLLGGTVSGLSEGGKLTIANGSDTVVVGANGGFTFPNRLGSGASYKVSLTNSPRGHDCRLSNAAAIVASADVTSISVQCIPVALAGMEVVLHQPTGLAIDAEGNAYVADSYYHLIQKITPAGVVSIFAGAKNGGAGNVDGTAGDARFNFDNGTAMIVDRDANLIVTDSCSQSIRKVTKAGIVTTVAGRGSATCTSFSTVKDGVGSAAGFTNIRAIALDINGDYLVSDGQYAIRRVTPAGVVSTIRWTSPALAGSAERLDYVSKLTVDKNGTIYALGSSGSRVWKIANGLAVPFAGGAVATTSAVDGVGAAAGFRSPQALTSDNGGNLYVSDWATMRKISPDGTVSTLAGAYPPPSTINPPPPDAIDGTGAAARFLGFGAIAADPSGKIIALDEGWATLRYITAQGVVTTHPGTPLTKQYRDGVGGSARFTSSALSLAPTIDAKGNIFVRDFYTVRMITPDGTVSRYAGTFGLTSAVDGSKDIATLGLNGPMAADNAGNLYFSSAVAVGLRKIGSSTVSTVFQRPELANATAVAVSPSGNLAVASMGTVRVYSPDGTVLDTIDQPRIVASLGKSDSSSFGIILGLVYDPSGNLFIGDLSNSVIHKLSKEGKLSVFAGTPRVTGFADGAPGTGTLSVGSLTMDSSGNLYTMRGVRVNEVVLRKITPSGVISTLSTPWENIPISGVTYGNGRLYAMSQNALMQMWVP